MKPLKTKRKRQRNIRKWVDWVEKVRIILHPIYTQNTKKSANQMRLKEMASSICFDLKIKLDFMGWYDIVISS